MLRAIEPEPKAALSLCISRQSLYITPIMRTEEHRPVRLEDYRPPDWLIDTVDLDVSLDPNATRVRAKLQVRPNAGAAPAPPIARNAKPKAFAASPIFSTDRT